MNKNNIAVAVILTASVLLFTGGLFKKYSKPANTGIKKKTATIAVIPKGTTNMWWSVVRNGARKAGQEENVKILWNGPELETDRERQIQTVEDALIQKVDAVVFGPNDFKAMARPVDKIADAKIPCIIIDSPVDNQRFDSFVATDNKLGGTIAARELGKAIGGKGNVVLIRYVPNSASTDERAQGFLDTMKKEFPGVKIIVDQYTQGSVEDSRQRTVDILTRNKKVDGIFAVNQPTAIGAYKALQTHGLAGKVKYVGFDSDPVLLEGIEKNHIVSLVVQNPFEIGYLGVKNAVKCLKGEKIPRYVPVKSLLVNKQNLAKMKKEFPAALGL